MKGNERTEDTREHCIAQLIRGGINNQWRHYTVHSVMSSLQIIHSRLLKPHSVTSFQTTAPLSRPHGQDHCGPGQGWNLNPVCVGRWVSGWLVSGLLVIGSHGILERESTIPHSISLSILLKVHHPGRTISRRAAPCRGWRGGK